MRARPPTVIRGLRSRAARFLGHRLVADATAHSCLSQARVGEAGMAPAMTLAL